MADEIVTTNGIRGENLGFMWYDNNIKTSLKQKVDAAVAFYQEKYGLDTLPKEIYMSVGMTEGFTLGADGTMIISDIKVYVLKYKILPDTMILHWE